MQQPAGGTGDMPVPPDPSFMHENAKPRPGETLFALALVLFSAAAFWQSFAISGFKGLATAGTFPMLASAAMLASSLLVLVATVRRGPGSASQDVAPTPTTSAILPLPVVIVAGLVAIYVMLMPLFGFMLSSAAFLFASFWYLWRKGWLVSLALTLVALAAIYAVFRLVFQVVLPTGSLVRGIF
jgi:putative tricarboxylic transport membrane protein